MSRRILVPLDGSRVSEEVVPWVDELAAAMDADVELVRILERDGASDAVLGEVAFSKRLSANSTTADPPSVSSMQAEASEEEARLALARTNPSGSSCRSIRQISEQPPWRRYGLSRRSCGGGSFSFTRSTCRHRRFPCKERQSLLADRRATLPMK